MLQIDSIGQIDLGLSKQAVSNDSFSNVIHKPRIFLRRLCDSKLLIIRPPDQLSEYCLYQTNLKIPGATHWSHQLKIPKKLAPLCLGSVRAYSLLHPFLGRCHINLAAICRANERQIEGWIASRRATARAPKSADTRRVLYRLVD